MLPSGLSREPRDYYSGLSREPRDYYSGLSREPRDYYIQTLHPIVNKAFQLASIPIDKSDILSPAEKCLDTPRFEIAEILKGVPWGVSSVMFTSIVCELFLFCSFRSGPESAVWEDHRSGRRRAPSPAYGSRWGGTGDRKGLQQVRQYIEAWTKRLTFYRYCIIFLFHFSTMRWLR